MGYVVGTQLFPSCSMSSGIRELLRPIRTIIRDQPLQRYGGSRSFRPRNGTTEPQWPTRCFLLQNVDGWCFFSPGQDFICVATEHSQLSPTKGNVSNTPGEQASKVSALFQKKAFQLILTWQKSFACIPTSTVVTAAFNECKMIRKTSFAVGCQLVTGER